MNRRRFMQMFGAAIPAAIVAPTYFFAPRDGWHQAESGLYLHNGIILSQADYMRFVRDIKPHIWTPPAHSKKWSNVHQVAY